MQKVCTKCGEPKDLIEFEKDSRIKDGYASSCLQCKRDRSKKHYQKHKEKYYQKSTQYRLAHSEKTSLIEKKYRKLHREQINKRQKERLNTDPAHKIRCYLSHRLYSALKGKTKSTNTMSLVGCSKDKLQQHLEQQFQTGMSWGNYGRWHIDHIKPCASFDLNKSEEQQRCFNYTNLQPLWALDNIKKSDSITAS